METDIQLCFFSEKIRIFSLDKPPKSDQLEVKEKELFQIFKLD